MASTSETGHARNVANFEKMISICTGYGPKFNPSNPHLQIAALKDVLTHCRACLGEVNTQSAAYKKAVGARQSCYNTLKPLSTRLVNALAATDAPAKLKNDCKSIHRRIQGTRAGGGKSPKSSGDTAAQAEPTEKSISTSRQSFDLLAEHFSGLIALLESEPGFQPNETALQLPSLKTCHSDILKANAAAADSGVGLGNARMARNKALYADKTSLCERAAGVKAYVRSLFGVSSAEYRQISGLQFVKRK